MAQYRRKKGPLSRFEVTVRLGAYEERRHIVREVDKPSAAQRMERVYPKHDVKVLRVLELDRVGRE